MRQADRALRASYAFDAAGNWLSGLPASPFTNFLSGALLLLRRALLPAGLREPVTVGCAGPAAASSGEGSGCSGGLLTEPPANETPIFWYADTYGPSNSPLRGTAQAPLIATRGQDSIHDYPDDGAQGIIRNYSGQTIVLTAFTSYGKGMGDSVWQRAILLHGDEIAYQMFTSVNEQYSDISFSKLNGRYDERFEIGIKDPWSGTPTAYFTPPGREDPANTWTLDEGEDARDIWGSIRTWIKREDDGWQPSASQAYLDRYPNPSNWATSDWAIFTIHIDGI